MDLADAADLTSAAATRDPAGAFAALRDQDPVWWSERHRAWILTGYADVVDALTSPLLSADRISKAEARINWQRPAVGLARRVRAFSSWPVAETLLDGQQLRCFASEPAADDRAADGVPGTIVATGDGGILVQTGTGQLWLRTVQLPGRQRVAGADFARGRALVGKVLG